jgi:hypothetical protein
MGGHVEPGQIGGRGCGGSRQLGGRDYPVKESGRDGVIGREHLGERNCPGEMRRRQPLPADLDRHLRHGEPDGHLISGDLVGASRAKPVIAGQQQERAERHRVAGAGDEHRGRKRQESSGQLEARPDHGGRRGAACPEHRQVKASGEHPGPAGQHDYRLVRAGAVERFAELRQHLRGRRVHLAVVHRDRGDRIRQLIRHEGAHVAVSL